MECVIYTTDERDDLQRTLSIVGGQSERMLIREFDTV